MNYYIHYSPVFHKGDKKLAGYNMFVSKRYEDTTRMMDVITVECEDWKEYDRYSEMLSGVYDPFDAVAFVDKHPVDILNFLRGVKAQVKKSADWEKDIPRWSVNLRGERV